MLRPGAPRLQLHVSCVRNRPVHVQHQEIGSICVASRTTTHTLQHWNRPRHGLRQSSLSLQSWPSLPLRQTRTLRTIPISKQKHPKTSRYNNDPRLPPLGATPAGAYRRRIVADTLPLRTGVLAVKKGMTAVYVDATGEVAPNSSAGTQMVAGTPLEGGRRVPATVLQLDRNQVVANKTRARHGYFAVVVGEGWRKPRRVGRAMLGMFAKAKVGEAPEGSPAAMQQKAAKKVAEAKAAEDAKKPKKATVVMEGEDEEPELQEEEDAAEESNNEQKQGSVGLPPKREIREFKVRDENGLLPIGAAITPSHFTVGQFIDARGTARGMGFAGGMKRHGFHGQPASHGVSKTHRSMGSAGGGQGSGSRVHPGKRMAGNMGGQRHTVQSLKVLMVDETNGLVVVTGAVSGRKGDLVMLSDAIKKPWPETLATV